ncbi:5492_t:CDS:2 [Entrophospora sp. SA101]|nr:13527_t:CDS:2 [Entrophospora sp. SA101]CAJ0637072.1 10853_t:CDS:2 [Entrophospora sp. SA101]CAJ0747692.1 5492_t:CDS:2 [Entrophospora sp. SA101]CAJ0837480.1 2039_t:CDS:2 [Entrophospora sp. SA101]CAJ0909345.1 768_t:CDS:2 [Entrophospora sp. SA101]
MSSSTEEFYIFVENWDMETLIIFLKHQDLNLEERHLGFLHKQEINGQAFLLLTEEKPLGPPCNLTVGPDLILAEQIKILKDNKKRAFSSFKTQNDLKEVLKNHGIVDGYSIINIPQFEPVTYKIRDDEPALKLCIDGIIQRLRNMGPVIDSNEAMRCEYISAILHLAVTIVKDYTIKKHLDNTIEKIFCITEGKQYQPGIGMAQNIMQCKNSCDTNRRKRKAEKAFESDYEYIYGIVSTGMDWFFLLYTMDGIYCTSKTEYHISLTKASLKDCTALKSNVKRILEVIVGLLED